MLDIAVRDKSHVRGILECRPYIIIFTISMSHDLRVSLVATLAR